MFPVTKTHYWLQIERFVSVEDEGREELDHLQ